MMASVGEFDGYIGPWRERWARERESALEAAKAARAVAERLAGLLRARYGARRVILGGSLARGDFHRGSDIDLAVEGISPEEFFRAGAALEENADGFAVDLVPLESASPRYLATLEREGIVLHDSRRA
ncbi:MAG: nucleotidyltransferase family protein [Candidatus Binatia bacterium]